MDAECDYICDFLLLNLDRIEILIDNSDKIRPQYVPLIIQGMVAPVALLPENYKVFKNLALLI